MQSQSRYENLPVYKKAQDLAVYFETLVRNFEKYHKYTIGADFRNLSRRILILVAKANTQAVRLEYLTEALDNLLELKILVHFGKEVKAFRSFKNFETAVKLVENVSRQCEGWFRSQSSSSGTP
jgi:hypothetical protein